MKIRSITDDITKTGKVTCPNCRRANLVTFGTGDTVGKNGDTHIMASVVIDLECPQCLSLFIVSYCISDFMSIQAKRKKGIEL